MYINLNFDFVLLDILLGLYSSILSIIFWTAILAGTLIIIRPSPIVSVLFLISLFLVISGNLILVGVHFIGLSYLLVYVGAISILFLFTLMLINIRISELLSNSGSSLSLGFVFALIFFLMIPNESIDLDVYFANTHMWDGVLIKSPHMFSLGNVMYTIYWLWFGLVGLILLLAMFGSIAVTVTVKKDSGDEPEKFPVNGSNSEPQLVNLDGSVFKGQKRSKKVIFK